MKENNQFILPIESVEIRSAKDSSPKRRIRAKAKLVPGKEYAYLFEYDKDKRPKLAKKEIFSNEGWERIKKKILSKRIFVDENHKTVASMNIDKWLNQLARETGKDLTELKKKINEWMKVSEMPLFKMEDIELEDDAIVTEITMNPYFAEIDSEHRAYYDAVWGSLKEGYINGLSLNFNPTDVTTKVDYSTGTTVPIINDADIYGISFVSGPAYEDMAGVLDVAIRSAQEKIGGKNMAEQGSKEQKDKKGQQDNDPKVDPTKIKNDVKKELKMDTLVEENQKLKKELEKTQQEIEQKKKEQEELEKQRLVEENEKIKAQLAERDKLLQSGSRGFVNGNLSDKDWLTDFKSKLENLSLGELAHLQGEFNTLGMKLSKLNPISAKLAMEKKADMVAPSKSG